MIRETGRDMVQEKTFHSPWAKRLASSIVKQGACIVSEYVVGRAWHIVSAACLAACDGDVVRGLPPGSLEARLEGP